MQVWNAKSENYPEVSYTSAVKWRLIFYAETAIFENKETEIYVSTNVLPKSLKQYQTEQKQNLKSIKHLIKSSKSLVTEVKNARRDYNSEKDNACIEAIHKYEEVLTLKNKLAKKLFKLEEIQSLEKLKTIGKTLTKILKLNQEINDLMLIIMPQTTEFSSEKYLWSADEDTLSYNGK